MSFQFSFPSSTSSSSSSIRAVKAVSTMSGNFSFIRSLTTSPRGVVRRFFPSFTTYSRSRMVEMVGA